MKKITRADKIAASKAAKKGKGKGDGANQNPTQTGGTATAMQQEEGSILDSLESDTINLGGAIPAEDVIPVIPIEQIPAGETAIEIVKNVGSAVPVNTANYLTDEAFAQRKLDVASDQYRPVAADYKVRQWAEKLAAETSRDLAVSPITLQEYVDYRDTAVAKKAAAPKANNTFTSETFEKIVRPLSNQGLKNRIFAKFAGREGVDVDETLLALAEMFAASETGRKTNTHVDGGVEICVNPACPTHEKKFVPTTFVRPIKARHEGEEDELRTEGQFLADAGVLKPYCRVCKPLVLDGIFKAQAAWRGLGEEERKTTPFPKMIRFLSRADAQTHADRQAYAIGKQADEKLRDQQAQEEHDRHRMAVQQGALGTIQQLQIGRPTNRLSDEVRRKSHLNVGEALSGDPDVKGIFSVEGPFKTRNGNTLRTHVAIQFDRGEAKVLEAGRLLNDYVGMSGSSKNLPSMIKDFLKQIQEKG